MFRAVFYSLILMSVACSHRAPVGSAVTSPGPSVGLYSHWVDVDSGEQVELTGEFGDALLAALRLQGFTGVITTVPTVEALGLGSARTEDRAKALVQAAGQETSQSLVVEARASLFSQLQGQYRWVVSVDATLVKDSSQGLVTETTSVEIPVFLRYQHQGESEAFEAAAPSLDRALSPLLRGLR